MMARFSVEENFRAVITALLRGKPSESNAHNNNSLGITCQLLARPCRSSMLVVVAVPVCVRFFCELVQNTSKSVTLACTGVGNAALERVSDRYSRRVSIQVV